MQYFQCLVFLPLCRIGLGKRTEHLRGPFIGAPVFVGNYMLDPAFSDLFNPCKIFGSLGFRGFCLL